MSKPAAPSAFQATFSDVRLVKGRKVCQLVFELPLEGADAALSALGGFPRPDREVWVGVARLDLPKGDSEPPKPTNEPYHYIIDGNHYVGTGELPESIRTKITMPKERRRFEDLPLPQQAGICCNEPLFWRFLAEESTFEVSDDVGAARAVREMCHVNSRAEIGEGPVSGNLWRLLRDRYQAWKLAAEHVE